jgi:hypothetical protein
MNKLARVLAVAAALVMASACGGGSSGGDPAASFRAAIQGTWYTCQSTGTSYEKISLTVNGSAFTEAITSYTAAACTGTGTPMGSGTGTIVIGSSVTANLGAVSVTAWQINPTFGGTTSYDLAYIDAGVTPNRLYLGDSSGVNDGTTAAKRPTALDPTFFLLKQ